jgi:hypothetical protein
MRSFGTRRHIKFMMSVSTYEALLLPPPPDEGVPKYLLPARDDVCADPPMAAAPLYAKFRTLIGPAIPITEEGLNFRLHKISALLEQALPMSH